MGYLDCKPFVLICINSRFYFDNQVELYNQSTICSIKTIKINISACNHHCERWTSPSGGYWRRPTEIPQYEYLPWQWGSLVLAKAEICPASQREWMETWWESRKRNWQDRIDEISGSEKYSVALTYWSILLYNIMLGGIYIPHGDNWCFHVIIVRKLIPISRENADA